MLEIAEAKNSLQIAKWNGRVVCSAYDPVKEARDWVNVNSKRIARHHTVVVLGVGCAYHIAELANQFPKIRVVAIDTNLQLIKLAEKIHSLDLAKTELICLTDIGNATSNAAIQKIINKRFLMLRFQPACNSDSPFYEALAEMLVGRTAEGFLFYGKHRKDLSVLLNAEVIVRDANKLATIKTLVDLMNDKVSVKCRHILYALRELVK